MPGKFIFVGIRDFKYKEKARIKNKELHKKRGEENYDESRKKYENKFKHGTDS